MADIRPAEPAPEAPTHRSRSGAWYPVLAYGAVAAVLAAVAWYSVAHLPMATVPKQWRAFHSRPWLDGWARWDAGWYWGIARHGYFLEEGRQSAVAFFPGYPLLMRLLAPLTGGPLLAGIVVTAASGLAAAVLFHRWCARLLSGRTARVALLVLLAYPFAYYLVGAVYGDALFLATVLAAFLLLEHDRPVLAGLAGAFATATRPVGVAVVAGLVLRALERRGALRWPPRRGRLQPADAGVVLSILGLLAFAALLWVRFRQPLAFAGQGGEWGQPPGPRTWFKLAWLRAWAEPAWDITHVRLGLHALLTAGALALVPAVVRRLGWGYGVYAFGVIAIPAVASADFTGLGRYLLAAFPCFAVAGELLAHRPLLRATAFAAGGVTLVAMTSLYARWNYVS